MSFPNFEDYRRQNEVLTDVVAFSLPVTGACGTPPGAGSLVSANYFDVLTPVPAGRFFFATKTLAEQQHRRGDQLRYGPINSVPIPKSSENVI
jgi:hypothetical protein